MGAMPEVSFGTDDDPERVVRLTAHALARLADRLPFSRRIARHLEGTDNRAGLGSDLLAILVELARRNPDAIEQRLQGFGDDLQKARAARAHQQAAKAAQSQSAGGVSNAA